MKNLLKINWKRLLLDNWILKLASLTVAFVLWFAVRTVDDPVDDKTFNNIKVNLVNTEELTKMNKVYEVLDGSDTVRSVTFEAPESVRDVIEPGDIVAVADIDDLTDINTVAIQFSCPKYSNEVTDIRGSIGNVKLNVEDKKVKYINIGKNIIGEVAENYKLGDVNLSINRLEIEGPASKIDAIARAMVDINVVDINDDIFMEAVVYFQDKDGNKVAFDSVKQNVNNVDVDVEVLTVKEVPVEFVPYGEVAEGYLLTGEVDGIPETVKVAGKPQDLSDFEKITISEELDLNGATSDVVETVNLNHLLGEGIVLADDDFSSKIKVTVYVEDEVERNLKVRSENLTFENVPSGMAAEVVPEQEMPSLQVKGLRSDLSSLREATLSGTIDVAAWMSENQMTELTVGVRSLPITFNLTEGQNVTNVVYVQVLFSEVEETAVTGQ